MNGQTVRLRMSKEAFRSMIRSLDDLSREEPSPERGLIVEVNDSRRNSVVFEVGTRSFVMDIIERPTFASAPAVLPKEFKHDPGLEGRLR